MGHGRAVGNTGPHSRVPAVVLNALALGWAYPPSRRIGHQTAVELALQARIIPVKAHLAGTLADVTVLVGRLLVTIAATRSGLQSNQPASD